MQADRDTGAAVAPAGQLNRLQESLLPRLPMIWESLAAVLQELTPLNRNAAVPLSAELARAARRVQALEGAARAICQVADILDEAWALTTPPVPSTAVAAMQPGPAAAAPSSIMAGDPAIVGASPAFEAVSRAVMEISQLALQVAAQDAGIGGRAVQRRANSSGATAKIIPLRRRSG